MERVSKQIAAVVPRLPNTPATQMPAALGEDLWCWGVRLQPLGLSVGNSRVGGSLRSGAGQMFASELCF